MKVLIIDDEQTVLSGLSSIYDWEVSGFTKVQTSSSSLEAIELAEKEAFDLVITDIKMPEMDGLRLSEYLLKLQPQIYIIILSGYGEFEYAKKAISLGISEYLLKPIQTDAFEQAVEKAKKYIIESKSNKIKYTSMKNKIEMLIPMAKNHFFNNFLEEPSRYIDRIEELFYEFNIGITEKDYVILKLDLDMEMNLSDVAEMDRTFLKSIISDNSDTFEAVEIFTMSEKIVLCIQDQDITENRFVKMEEWLKQLNQISMNTLGFSFSAAVSSVHSRLDEIDTAGRECDLAFTDRFINGGKKKFLKYQKQSKSSETTKYFYNLIEEIIINIKLRNIEKTKSITKEMFAQMREMKKLSIDHYYGVVYSVLGELYDICQQTSNTEIKNTHNFSYDSIRRFNTLKSLEHFLVETIEEKLTESIVKGNLNNKGTISSVLNYINKNYKKNLTLANVSDKVFLSPNYLCNLFKKELGINFNTYLTQVRINRAKELLKETNYTTQFIATEIGYSDYSYFSQIFKKQTGMTPTEYKYSQID